MESNSIPLFSYAMIFGSVLFGSVRFGIFGKYRTESVRNAISELGINFYNIWM